MQSDFSFIAYALNSLYVKIQNLANRSLELTVGDCFGDLKMLTHEENPAKLLLCRMMIKERQKYSSNFHVFCWGTSREGVL